MAAGAFNNNDYDNLDQKRKEEIAILAETENVPRHLLSVRKDMDPALVSCLKEILLFMHQDGEGRKHLKKIDNTTKFDLLPGGEEIAYQKIRELFPLFERK